MPKYKVPNQIQEVASRAIEQNLARPISQRAAYKDENGKRVAGTGMRTARRLVSGAVDKQQLILMRAWFARHGASPKEKEARKDKTSRASIAYRLWGGSGAISWINQTLRKIEKEEDK
jgi:hypothetical protein